MSLRSRINPGDFLRAAHHVQAEDPATLERIAELLGLQLVAGGTLPRPLAPPPQPPPRNVPSESWAPENRLGSDAEFAAGGNDAWAEPLALAPSAPLPVWFASVPTYPPTGSARDVPELPQIPLLNPLWARAILIEALARASDDGEIDLELLAEQIGAGAPLERLPRRPRQRLHQRVLVLVDNHESMAPFREDQRQLLAEIAALLPKDLVDVVESEGCPVVTTAPAERSYGFFLPGRGTTVLLLSDLGAGATRRSAIVRSGAPAWRRFVETLWRRRCPVVAFVPSDPGQVSPDLRRWIAVLPWRPETTSAKVRSLRRQLRILES